MDAIELLTQDHRNVERIFDRLEGSTEPRERAKLAAEVVGELSVHAAVEEQILYPAMRSALGSEDDIDHAEHEHAKAKAMAFPLTWLPPDDERFAAAAARLADSVRHHVEEEEQDLFPRLRDALTGDQLDELGARLRQAKGHAPVEPGVDEILVLTRDDLYEVAQDLEIAGRSEMDKEQLAEAVAGS